MDYARFVQLRRPIWDRFERGLQSSSAGLREMDHQQVEELAIGYRQVLHDHALAASRYPETGAALRLSRLALDGTRILMRDHARRRSGPWHFATHTFPTTFRRHLPVFGVCAALFLVTTWFGLMASIYQPGLGLYFVGPQAVEGLEQGRLWTESMTSTSPPAVNSSAIATNNISVALTAWAGGAVAGLGSFYILILNGLMLGSVIGVTLHYSMAHKLFEFIAAHGPLELSLIIVASGAGLLIGRALVAADDRPRAEALRAASLDAVVILVGCIPWFVLLSLVESFVSPSEDVALGSKVILGIVLELAFLLVAWNPFLERGSAG